jgi:dTDP-4-dehydrorhamnose 3,5-epimerase
VEKGPGLELTTFMEVIETGIDGLLIIKPRVFEDPRGYFFESFNKNNFNKAGILDEFVQDNQSLSQKGVLRGLHFQKPPYDQGKLVRVISGSVLDVAVDIRKDSKTYGQHYKMVLNSTDKTMFWVPSGFAHGFLTLEDNTIFFYKCTNFYNKDSEVSISWNDKDLGIDWGITDPVLSEKDKQGESFSSFRSPF